MNTSYLSCTSEENNDINVVLQDFMDFIRKIVDFGDEESNDLLNYRFKEDLLFDSLDIMNMIIEVSDKYNVMIEIDDIADNPTIGGLWNALNKMI